MHDKKSISRATRSKNDTRVFYDRISRLFLISEGFFKRKHLKIGVKRLSVNEGDVVLEIGIGTGDSVLEFAQLVGDSGKVYGVDISQGMLDITKMKLQKEGLLDRAELVNNDAVSLSFTDDSFDKIFMSLTLELFDTPEIPKVLSECFRILKKNGRICVVSLSKKKSNTTIRIYKWLRGVFPSLFNWRPIFLEEALNDAGFQTTNSSLIFMLGLPFEIVVGGPKK
jgi:demethylmenaquinone methyltransferase/2-methoxy-6-polyprenyl-1,4-benzoquinol methylase